MYILQSLWTMAGEGLNVTVLVFANRSYQILKRKYAQVGAGAPSKRATSMLNIDRPAFEWVALAMGHGLPACRVSTLGQLPDALCRSMNTEGPSLVEVILLWPTLLGHLRQTESGSSR
jgi:acetolactate synthase-1/2/3 large subunit